MKLGIISLKSSANTWAYTQGNIGPTPKILVLPCSLQLYLSKLKYGIIPDVNHLINE